MCFFSCHRFKQVLRSWKKNFYVLRSSISKIQYNWQFSIGVNSIGVCYILTVPLAGALFRYDKRSKETTVDIVNIISYTLTVSYNGLRSLRTVCMLFHTNHRTVFFSLLFSFACAFWWIDYDLLYNFSTNSRCSSIHDISNLRRDFQFEWVNVCVCCARSKEDFTHVLFVIQLKHNIAWHSINTSNSTLTTGENVLKTNKRV